MNDDLVYRKSHKDWRESVVNTERRLDTIEEKLDRVLDGLERLNLANTQLVDQPMVRSTTDDLRYIW